MRALTGTLVHPRRARTQVAVAAHAHACPALLPTFLSRFLSSGARTYKHKADLHPDPRCGLAAPLSQVQSSHIYSDEASKSNIQGTVLIHPGLNSIGLADHQDHAVQHTCDARDSEDRGTCASGIRVRSKGQKRPESLESSHQTVVVIESCEQVSPAGAATLRKSRALKYTSSEDLAAVLKVLEKFLGSSERASQALAASPSILYQGSELLEQKLTVLAHIGVSEKVFRKICTTQSVLSRELELLHSILNVYEEVGLSAKARNKVLWSQPRMARSKGINLLHALDFFTSLGMNEKEVLKVMERRPTMFFFSVSRLMGYYTFCRQLGLSVKELTRVLCRGLPTLAIGTLQTRVKFFKDQGFSASDVHVLIVQKPAILALRCNHLKEKLNFLLCEQKYDTADVVKCPVCLMLSLQDRVIPRLTALKERGLSKVYALSTILCCKDAEFKKLGSKGKKR